MPKLGRKMFTKLIIKSTREAMSFFIHTLEFNKAGESQAAGCAGCEQQADSGVGGDGQIGRRLSHRLASVPFTCEAVPVPV